MKFLVLFEITCLILFVLIGLSSLVAGDSVTFGIWLLGGGIGLVVGIIVRIFTVTYESSQGGLL